MLKITTEQMDQLTQQIFFDRLIRFISEHDCALFLVMLAVCRCEGISPPEIDGMVDHVGENEVRIKKFISERGYFRFSDFDYPGGGPEEESHG